MMRTRDELLQDIEMCIASHQEMDKLIDQMSYYKTCIRERMKFIRHPETTLREPEAPGEKPNKPPRPNFGVRDRLPLRKSAKQEAYERACEEYNRQLKEYYIKYREYEKACDRFKEALARWEEQEKERLLRRSHEDVKQARKNIKKGNRLLKIYLEVIQHSQVHPHYQEIDVLQKFKSYLETGRAQTVQECINLYETETCWERLRGSQERLEHQLSATIYLLQSDLTQAIPEAACTQDNPPDAPPPARKWRLFSLPRRKKAVDGIPEFKISRSRSRLRPGFLGGKLASIKYRILKFSPF